MGMAYIVIILQLGNFKITVIMHVHTTKKGVEKVLYHFYLHA